MLVAAVRTIYVGQPRTAPSVSALVNSVRSILSIGFNSEEDVIGVRLLSGGECFLLSHHDDDSDAW